MEERRKRPRSPSHSLERSASRRRDESSCARFIPPSILRELTIDMRAAVELFHREIGSWISAERSGQRIRGVRPLGSSLHMRQGPSLSSVRTHTRPRNSESDGPAGLPSDLADVILLRRFASAQETNAQNRPSGSSAHLVAHAASGITTPTASSSSYSPSESSAHRIGVLCRRIVDAIAPHHPSETPSAYILPLMDPASNQGRLMSAANLSPRARSRAIRIYQEIKRIKDRHTPHPLRIVRLFLSRIASIRSTDSHLARHSGILLGRHYSDNTDLERSNRRVDLLHRSYSHNESTNSGSQGLDRQISDQTSGILPRVAPSYNSLFGSSNTGPQTTKKYTHSN
eukprot:TRINITY_DN4131_c1_g1_i3.p1 TRINITY_DN4131_c1_g1~~TRINITY_DN4131_c1_g1_i3.p1  ORF type:complete len:342 (-),score=43.82 TRINITY_DN4131_c1_g1_i3:831-1856(-)